MWYSIDKYYQISEDGQVRSLDRQIYLPQNGGWVTKKGMILKPGLSGGYLAVVLCYDNKRVTKSIHRLIAEMFIPNPDNLSEVNHKNGVKTDNRIENLEWVTKGDNIRHAFRTGLNKPRFGEENGNNKLKNIDVSEIFRLRSEKFTQQEIASKVGVCQTTVGRVLLGRIWKQAI